MLTPDPDGVLLAIRVKPRASSTRIEGERAGRLLVQVTAPPLDGRANDAVCRLLARALSVAPSRVEVVSGGRSRDKLVRIRGTSTAQARTRLGLTPNGP